MRARMEWSCVKSPNLALRFRIAKRPSPRVLRVGSASARAKGAPLEVRASRRRSGKNFRKLFWENHLLCLFRSPPHKHG